MTVCLGEKEEKRQQKIKKKRHRTPYTRSKTHNVHVLSLMNICRVTLANTCNVPEFNGGMSGGLMVERTKE